MSGAEERTKVKQEHMPNMTETKLEFHVPDPRGPINLNPRSPEQAIAVMEEIARERLANHNQRTDDLIQRQINRALGGAADRVDYINPDLWSGRRDQPRAASGRLTPSVAPDASGAGDTAIFQRLAEWQQAMLDIRLSPRGSRTETPAAATAAREPEPDLQLSPSDSAPFSPPALPTSDYLDRLRRVGATALLSKLESDRQLAAVQSLILSRGLRFYQRPNVESYLLQKAKKWMIQSKGKHATDYGLTWRLAVEWTSIPLYTQPIPVPVLDTIESIRAEHPTAEFLISEVREYPDPFLMVRVYGKEMIIERWDEPAYREAE